MHQASGLRDEGRHFRRIVTNLVLGCLRLTLVSRPVWNDMRPYAHQPLRGTAVLVRPEKSLHTLYYIRLRDSDQLQSSGILVALPQSEDLVSLQDLCAQ